MHPFDDHWIWRDSPLLGFQPRGWVAGDEEEGSHGVHVTESCKVQEEVLSTAWCLMKSWHKHTQTPSDATRSAGHRARAAPEATHSFLCLCLLLLFPKQLFPTTSCTLQTAPNPVQAAQWNPCLGFSSTDPRACWHSANPSKSPPALNKAEPRIYLRGAPSAISMAVIPRDHKSLCKKKQMEMCDAVEHCHNSGHKGNPTAQPHEQGLCFLCRGLNLQHRRSSFMLFPYFKAW